MNTHTVKAGGASLRLWLVEGGRRWRWHYYRDGKRVTGSAVSLEKAKAKCKAYLATISQAPTGSSQRDASEFALWLASRRAGQSISDAVAAYAASIESSGNSPEYAVKTKSDLLAFATHTGPETKLAAIDPHHIEEWLQSRNVGPRRQNNLLATLVACFRYARHRGHLPATEPTTPERVPRRKLPRNPIGVFTPEQLTAILAAAEPEWRPAVAMQAFGGIRTAEVGRLYWRDIKVDRGYIEIPAGAAKTGRRRLVPILHPLPLWLPANPDPDEMVCPYEGHQVFQERMLRRNPHIKWITNGLRHSFGSYRCAILKDIAAVAFEMGNSAQMVQAHYHEAQELSAAKEWFSIAPTEQKGTRKGTKVFEKSPIAKTRKPSIHAA
jgi:integrase